MKRFRTAALAAFLTFSGILVGEGVEAYYFTACALSIPGSSVSIGVDDAGHKFSSTETLTCAAAGTSGCCAKEVVEIFKQLPGGGWTILSHTETTRNQGCGVETNYLKPFPVTGAGTFKATFKIIDCGAGATLYDAGSITHTWAS